MMPRDDLVLVNRSRGPLIIDYNEHIPLGHVSNNCNGLLYTSPFETYIPLRNSVARYEKSLALTVFGGKLNHKLIGSKAHRPGSCGIRYRNPKSFIKKQGDMT